MATRYININFPFKDSPKGFFLDLNSSDQQAIKADLLHLVLTRRGQRLYNPDFGTDLLKYIFEPEDGVSLESVKEEINSAIKKYLSKLEVNNISVTQSEDSDYAATVRIDYTVTDDVFNLSDFVIINL